MKRPTKKLHGIDLGNNYKITNGRIERNEAAINAKLDVSTRIQRRKSKKITYGKKAAVGQGRLI